MNWLDIVILVTVTISTIYSFYRGLIKEIFSFIALASAYAAANIFQAPLTLYADRVLPFHIPVWASYGGLFIVTLLLVLIAGTWLKRIINISFTLKAADSLGGGVLGFVKGLLIIFLLIFGISFFETGKPLIRQSTLCPRLIAYCRIMVDPLFSEHETRIQAFKRLLDEKIEHIKSMATEKFLDGNVFQTGRQAVSEKLVESTLKQIISEKGMKETEEKRKESPRTVKRGEEISRDDMRALERLIKKTVKE